MNDPREEAALRRADAETDTRKALVILTCRAIARAAGADANRAATIADRALAEFWDRRADVLSAHELADRIEQLVAEP